MKGRTLLTITVLLCFFIGMAACAEERDSNGGTKGSELDGMYSNKSGALPGHNILDLYIDGTAVFGKQAYFELKIENEPAVTLFNIIPGEQEFELSLDYPAGYDTRGFTTSGKALTPNGVTFDYHFDIIRGKLTLHIDELELPSNRITESGCWYPVRKRASEVIPADPDYTLYHRTAGFYLSPTKSNTLYELLSNVLGSLISTVLRDVTFTPDGYVTARYAPMPDELDIFRDLVSGNGIQDRPDSDWKVSPKYMVRYYVEEPYLYIVPDAEMLLQQLLPAPSRTRSAQEGEDEVHDEDDEGSSTDYIAIYNLITQWFTEGLRFTIEDVPSQPGDLDSGRYGVFEGDIFLYLDQTQIQPLVPLLSLVEGLLPDSLKEQPFLYSMVTGLIASLSEEMAGVESLKLGIYFNK